MQRLCTARFPLTTGLRTLRCAANGVTLVRPVSGALAAVPSAAAAASIPARFTAPHTRPSAAHRCLATSTARSHASAATTTVNAALSPIVSVPLHALDFPYLKRDPAASSHSGTPRDYARGTCAADAPLLIMHGLLGSAGNWRTTAPKLSSSRRILSLDVRNHGLSPHTEDMRFAACAADIISLMDAKGIDKCVLMGHSLGGKIAMACALLHPERIASVICVDMAPTDYSLGDSGWSGVSTIVDACARVPITEMRSRSEVDTFLKPYIPEFATRAFVMQNVVVTTIHDEASGEKTQHVSWRCNLPALHRALPGIAKFDLSIETHPPQYTQSSLFIGGGLSPYLTPKQYPDVRRQFADPQLVTIPDAGHWVHVDKTKEFVEIVRKFLDELEEGGR